VTVASPALDSSGLPQVGSRVSSRGRTIGEADITLFSALTGDWHPQHADAVWAESSPFGERIAHGMLVLSLASGLLPMDPERVAALRSIRNAVFKRPVRIGDTLRVEAEVSAVRPLGEGMALAELSWRVLNQEDAVTVRAQLELLWRIGEDDAESADAD
jgi:3-hydroxybutyryl-CoA dehydratase